MAEGRRLVTSLDIRPRAPFAPSLAGQRCPGCANQQDLFPFTMAFQPIVDITERRIIAHEALVRGPGGESAGWVLGKLTPELLYSFDQACRVKAIELAARLGLPCQLSINFLPNAVYEPGACIRATLRAASRVGMDLNRLTFEIVESEAITDPDHIMAICREYRRHGFRIALDDFGTAHSGFERLIELRPDVVKLDRKLVRDCDKDNVRLGVVTAMVRLARDIGFRLVVEGVERAGELEAVRDAGGRYVQGYVLARPAFERLVEAAELGALGLLPPRP